MPSRSRPTFAEAFRFWLKLGFISFGGPTGQIAIMHEELVERRRWISDGRFLHALNFCMLLPGPEAQQLATYCGWRLHGIRGGVVAGSLFVLPAAFLLYGLSWLYVSFGEVGWVAGVFYGLKPAVLAVVAAAALRIGRKALRSPPLWVIAVVALVAMRGWNAPFPLVIGGAALVGFLGGRRWPEQFSVDPAHPGEATDDERDATEEERTDPPSPPARWRMTIWRAVGTAVVCLAVWWLPVFLLGRWLGADHTLVREGLFFSRAAMITFGGAYAVLPYVSQQAVEQYGWLTAKDMLVGLGFAETTPGPLIMVLQFVGFLGGWHQPGSLTPGLAATLGAGITTWTTFVPSFLWILVGAPHLEVLRRQAWLSHALSAVTAAVVGVILNLALWFAWQVAFHEGHAVDGFVLVVAVIAFVGLWRWKWNLVAVVLGCGVLGCLWRLWT